MLKNLFLMFLVMKTFFIFADVRTLYCFKRASVWGSVECNKKVGVFLKPSNLKASFSCFQKVYWYWAGGARLSHAHFRYQPSQAKLFNRQVQIYTSYLHLLIVASANIAVVWESVSKFTNKCDTEDILLFWDVAVE